MCAAHTFTWTKVHAADPVEPAPPSPNASYIKTLNSADPPNELLNAGFVEDAVAVGLAYKVIAAINTHFKSDSSKWNTALTHVETALTRIENQGGNSQILQSFVKSVRAKAAHPETQIATPGQSCLHIKAAQVAAIDPVANVAGSPRTSLKTLLELPGAAQAAALAAAAKHFRTVLDLSFAGNSVAPSAIQALPIKGASPSPQAD